MKIIWIMLLWILCVVRTTEANGEDKEETDDVVTAEVHLDGTSTLFSSMEYLDRLEAEEERFLARKEERRQLPEGTAMTLYLQIDQGLKYTAAVLNGITVLYSTRPYCACLKRPPVLQRDVHSLWDIIHTLPETKKRLIKSVQVDGKYLQNVNDPLSGIPALSTVVFQLSDEIEDGTQFHFFQATGSDGARSYWWALPKSIGGDFRAGCVELLETEYYGYKDLNGVDRIRYFVPVQNVKFGLHHFGYVRCTTDLLVNLQEGQEGNYVLLDRDEVEKMKHH